MATEIWCELVCLCCARTSNGQFTYNGSVPRKALKATAKRDGWTFEQDAAYCEKCSEARTKENGP